MYLLLCFAPNPDSPLSQDAQEPPLYMIPYTCQYSVDSEFALIIHPLPGRHQPTSTVCPKVLETYIFTKSQTRVGYPYRIVPYRTFPSRFGSVSTRIFRAGRGFGSRMLGTVRYGSRMYAQYYLYNGQLVRSPFDSVRLANVRYGLVRFKDARYGEPSLSQTILPSLS
jgi:hypothetical protein